MTRSRVERGLLPDGEPPIYVEDYLVEVWRLFAADRKDDARLLFAGVWSWAMDNLNEAVARVALRLLDRLGFVTDDAEGWSAFPAELEVYRAETNPTDPTRGLCWTLDPSIAEMHAARDGLRVSCGAVAKGDALAYIAGRGEEEIVVSRERVKSTGAHTGAHPVSEGRKTHR